jgi:hypothetical protein
MAGGSNLFSFISNSFFRLFWKSWLLLTEGFSGQVHAPAVPHFCETCPARIML